MTSSRMRLGAVGPRAAVVLLAVLLALVGCATRFHSDAHFDTTYDWDSIETFAFDVRRPGVAASKGGQILEAALRERIVERGFREVRKDRADVLISYDLGTYAAARLSGASTWAEVEGGISVWVYDAETGHQIWYGWSERVITPQDEPEPTIRAAVDAIFANRMPRN